MIQDVRANIFHRVGEALGFVGEGGDFSQVETRESTPTFTLDPFMSESLTVTEWFAGRVTSAGAAGFENFDLFPTAAIAHPENAYMVSAGIEVGGGTPDAFMLMMGTTSPQQVLALWESIDGLFFTKTAPDQVPFPYWIPSRSPAAVGLPVAFASLAATRIHAGIDPTAIGDDVDWKILIHSAPQGVPVWGV